MTGHDNKGGCRVPRPLARLLPGGRCYNPARLGDLGFGRVASWPAVNREDTVQIEWTPVSILFVIWVAVTAVLLVLFLLRYRLSLREEDQLFLDRAEEHMAREQREIVARIEALSKWVMGFGIASGVLLLALAGTWVYVGLTRTDF